METFTCVVRTEKYSNFADGSMCEMSIKGGKQPEVFTDVICEWPLSTFVLNGSLCGLKANTCKSHTSSFIIIRWNQPDNQYPFLSQSHYSKEAAALPLRPEWRSRTAPSLARSRTMRVRRRWRRTWSRSVSEREKKISFFPLAL